MTANARVLENVISKMLSNSLTEVREIGDQLKAVARTEVPTLVKYADAVPYLVETARDLQAASTFLPATGSTLSDGEESCLLVDYDPNGETHILASALHRHAGTPYAESRKHVESISPGDRETLAAVLLGRLAAHDTPLREMEYANYTFELVMDQGAYAEFKRHRMMTQTPQRLTTRLGYAVPRLMVEAGIGSTYEKAMHAAADLYEDLAAHDVDVAQYAVPNGFRRRVLAQFNLREAFAFCELRSAPNAHFSIRRVAGLVAREIQRVHPLLGRYMRLPAETPSDVQAQHFSGSSPR
jgi:thymidylate synthase ThyX